jgi:hypothetical protein
LKKKSNFEKKIEKEEKKKTKKREKLEKKNGKESLWITSNPQ